MFIFISLQSLLLKFKIIPVNSLTFNEISFHIQVFYLSWFPKSLVSNKEYDEQDKETSYHVYHFSTMIKWHSSRCWVAMKTVVSNKMITNFLLDPNKQLFEIDCPHFNHK